MKNRRLIGLLWLLSTTTGILGQNPVSLHLNIKDSSAFPVSAVLKYLHLSNPVLLDYSSVNPIIENVIGLYENAGYPFVQVRLDSLIPLPSGIKGILSVTPGEKVLFDTLMNRTGYKISSKTLYRMMDIRRGDAYSEAKLNAANKRLNQWSFMRLESPPEVGFSPGKASVYLYPEKINANRFDGWIGLSPSANNKMTFSGALTLSLNNILAQGENWQFNWSRNQDQSQKLTLSAEIPFLVGLPFGCQGNFELFRQDTSYLNLAWSLGIPYYFNPHHYLNLFIRHKESSILTSTKNTESSTIQPFTNLLSGVSWVVNRLDNEINPYKGFKLKLEASTGRKSIPDSASVMQSEYVAYLSFYQPIVTNLTSAFVIQSGYQKSPITCQNEKFRLGGLNILRGFDEDVFYTEAYVVTSVEVRYLLDKNSHLIVLTDLGLLHNPDNTQTAWKTLTGLGVGGQIRTTGGIFRIIFAIGKSDDAPFNFRNSKIHLGYVGVF